MDTSNTSGKNRASSLLELSLDYNEKDQVLARFSELICHISGALYSQINLIDDENQWTVAECGMEFEHIPVEESICYITINNEEMYEIEDFQEDDQFQVHPLVTGSPHLKYYLGFPFKDEKGTFIGSSCLLHTETLDLTDQQIHSLKLVNQQVADYLILKKKVSVQSDKLAKQEKLVTKTRHDIRGPLSGIIGFSSLLETEIEDKKTLKNIGMIKQSAKNLLEYAEGSLQYEIDKKESEVATSVSTIIDRVSSLYSMQSTLKEIDLLFENQCSESCSINTMASNQIINIIGNVVSNAIKFSPVEGSIEISFGKTKVKDDNFIKVIIEDNGTGIPKEKLEALHKLQYVQSQKTDSDIQGFGIGLVEALRLLDQKGGNFLISSAVNQGTKVELNFPVQEE
ncbi:MAG: GAF domain-containing sensor histidine kinase [Balneola sp.]|tara:strand:- start:35436 stop:36629 length:1194 start_codon:yes stop_codon:yes gene_type:complete